MSISKGRELSLVRLGMSFVSGENVLFVNSEWFFKSTVRFQCWTAGFESKWDIKYGYRHKLKCNKETLLEFFFPDRNSIKELDACYWQHLFSYGEAKLDVSESSTGKAFLFPSVLQPLQHCSSGCRARAGWWCPFHSCQWLFPGAQQVLEEKHGENSNYPGWCYCYFILI